MCLTGCFHLKQDEKLRRDKKYRAWCDGGKHNLLTEQEDPHRRFLTNWFLFLFWGCELQEKKKTTKAGACFHFMSGTWSVKSRFSFLISWPLSMTSDWGYQRSVWLAHCASAVHPFGQPSLTFNLWGYHRERERETERSKGRSTYVITSPLAPPEGSGNQHIRADTIVHWNTVLAPRS